MLRFHKRTIKGVSRKVRGNIWLPYITPSVSMFASFVFVLALPHIGYAATAPNVSVNFAVLNDLVTFTPLGTTFETTFDTSGCPAGFAGKFRFDARLTNTSSSPLAKSGLLSDLMVQVATLSNGNLLQNAAGGPGGEGARLKVPKVGDFSDEILSPGEFVDAPFVICLRRI